MEVDLDKIREDFPDVEWSLEMAGETPVRCLVGKKDGKYKAFVVPPSEMFQWKDSSTFLKVNKAWPQGAAEAINKILKEK